MEKSAQPSARELNRPSTQEQFKPTSTMICTSRFANLQLEGIWRSLLNQVLEN